MEGIFSDLHQYNKAIESRIKAAGFKARVMQVFQAWEEWVVFPKEFLAYLKQIFLGVQPAAASAVERNDDLDGAPLSGDEKEDEDLDGIPLDGAALLKSALARRDFEPGPTVHSPSTGKGKSSRIIDDIDGIPLADDDIDGVPLDGAGKDGLGGGFIPSKWETIAPDQVEAQAITTSKWDTLEMSKGQSRKRSSESTSSDEESDDSARASSHSGQRGSYDEEKRSKLREVELQMIQYQDELESGSRHLREGMNLTSQLEQYRRKLMKKSLSELRSPGGNERYSGNSSDRRRSISPE